MTRREPLFHAPIAVVGLLGVLILVHLARGVLSFDDDVWVLSVFGLVPARFTTETELWPGGIAGALATLLTHGGLHADIAHLTINGAALLAFGSIVCWRIGALRFLVFLSLVVIAGGLAFLAANAGAGVILIGASGGTAGLVGAALRFIHAAIDAGALWKLRQAPRSVPALSLREALGERRVMAALAVLVALNVLIAVGLGYEGGSGPVAWEAHIGGLLAGFLLFGLFDPPGRPPQGGHSPDEADSLPGPAPAPGRDGHSIH